MSRVNDLSIHVATVNGSGSQSSNTILLRSIFNMGIPVSGKNLFPSNIQGLPTWFTIRANKDGWTARKVEYDVMVCMNPKTFEKDVHSVPPQAVLIHHENAKPLEIRKDIVSIAVPFEELVKTSTPDVKLRKLTVNMIYVGILAEFLGIPKENIDYAMSQQFKDKQKVIDVNQIALEAGRNFVKKNYVNFEFPHRLEAINKTKGKILIEGNAAAALGAVFSGCQFVSWYPITPSSSVVEFIAQYSQKTRLDKDTKKNNLAIVQAEDELSAIGMVLGASWMGARAMTTTSGPGISLMAEFVGYGFYTENPAVIVDVQRVGPSTGMPTRTAQGDILSAATLSHGDTRHPLLLPGNVQECYSFMAEAFDLAEELLTPVFLMSDLDLGMNHWMTEPFEYRSQKWKRGKVIRDGDEEKLKNFYRYLDVDGDGVPYRTLPGIKDHRGVFFTRGSGHDKYGNYTEGSVEYSDVLDRLLKKWEKAKTLVPKPVLTGTGKQSIGIIAYGSSEEPLQESLNQLKTEYQIEVDYLRLRAYPFTQEVGEFLKTHDEIYIVEQNQDSQMRQLISMEKAYAAFVPKIKSIVHYDGLPIHARFITNAVVDLRSNQMAVSS